MHSHIIVSTHKVQVNYRHSIKLYNVLVPVYIHVHVHVRVYVHVRIHVHVHVSDVSLSL